MTRDTRPAKRMAGFRHGASPAWNSGEVGDIGLPLPMAIALIARNG